MSWRDLLSTEFEDATFNPAATTAEVRGAEAELGLEFPDELRTLLLESNGVAADHSQPLVWSAQEIVRQNRLFREHAEFPDLYMPFDCLLFFGADVTSSRTASCGAGFRIRRTCIAGITRRTVGPGSPRA